MTRELTSPNIIKVSKLRRMGRMGYVVNIGYMKIHPKYERKALRYKPEGRGIASR
jgi:hypothetical protein